MSRMPILVFILDACLAPLCYGDLGGTQVTGSAMLPPSTVNQFDPTILAAPSYCDNTAGTTVTIADSNPNYDFCAIFTPAGTTGAPPAVAVVAAFSGTTLTIQVSLGTQSAWTPFQMTFTDTAFAGLTFVKYTDNFVCAPSGTCGVNASLSGSTITISGGVPPAGGIYNAAFTLTIPGSSLSFIAPPESALTFANPVLAWNPVPGAQTYTVWLSEEEYQTNNLYNSWQIPPGQTSTTLPLVLLGQPYNPGTEIGFGTTLWAEVNGVWSAFNSDISIATTNLLGTAPGNPGYLGSVQWESLVYPINGATDADPFKPFIWTMNGWHDGSTLTVGSTPGAADVYNSGTIQDTQLPHPIEYGAALPIPGLQPNTTYYARLIGPAGWHTATDIQFTTGLGKAHLITPADEAQQVASGSVTFTINPVQGALQYVLWLGTTPGGNDIGQGWPGAATSATVVLAPNAIYYARVWTELAGGDWTYTDSRFSTYATDVAFLAFPFNGEMHAVADAVIGLGVPQDVITIGWNQISDATGYTVWIGTSPGAHNVSDSYDYSPAYNMDTTYVSLSDNTTYYITLWTQKGSDWYATQSVLGTYPQTPASQYGSDPN